MKLKSSEKPITCKHIVFYKGLAILPKSNTPEN